MHAQEFRLPTRFAPPLRVVALPLAALSVLLPVLLSVLLFGFVGPALADEACPMAAGAVMDHSVMDHSAKHPADPAELSSGSVAASELGQSAFAAVAEMVRVLDSDPSVDWTKVRFDLLREHLIDMDRVMTAADVAVTELDDGFRARVTSADPRTLAAIRRMVSAHSKMMDGHRGWTVRAVDLDRGVEVEVRASDAAEVVRIRALGFAGFLVSGDHHRPHHRAMVLGLGH